jgi:hypothetical protein
LGNYMFPKLRFPGTYASGLGFTVSASGYVTETKVMAPLYTSSSGSSATRSFQLVRGAATPPGTITFSGLTVDGVCLGFNRPSSDCAVRTYTESGFTVVATTFLTAPTPHSPPPTDWFVRTDYGNPAPFIQFDGGGGSSVTGEVRVTSGGATFSFKSVDLYSSETPIPYTITGFRNAGTTFTMAATLPNPMGDFATVVNPQAADVINTLVIDLLNSAFSCHNLSNTCGNPMGLDNIVLTR